MSLAGSVTIGDIRGALARLDGVVHRTPVLTSRRLEAMVGARVFVKAENFQRIGSFKYRGASNAIMRLGPEERSRGVLTYSSGNHAQAIALAGATQRVPATIVMPSDAPRVKLDATRGYLAGAPAPSEVVVYDRMATTREALGERIARERGLVIIPPYDHPDVIAGQGTCALELLEQLVADEPGAGLDRLYVCCGGGGLLSGCAIAAKALAPGCEVIGVEPEAADDATRSFASRTLHTVENPGTIADGARTPFLGRYTFAMVCAHADRMMTVGDDALVGAMRFAMASMKIVVEPTGALALAGLLRDAMERPEEIRGQRIGVIISGGNVDLTDLARLLLD